MTSKGFHRYAIGAIKYDKADIARRQKRHDVAELAASRKKLAINPLLVGPEGVLVAGRDRLAAELLNGSRDLWVHVVSEVTPRELLELEVEENVRRRDVDRDQQLARLVQVVEKDNADEPSGLAGPRHSGPSTPRSEARRTVAKLAGTSTGAIRQAERRAAAKADPPEAADAAPPIRTFGLPVEPLIAEDARANQEIIDAADRAGQQAQRWLREMADALAKTADRTTEVRARSLLDQAHELTARVRGERPEALCPYGKGRCTEACLFCRGTIYVTAEQMRTPIPAELLVEGAYAMVIDGRGGFERFSAGGGDGEPQPVAGRPSQAGRSRSNGGLAGSSPARPTISKAERGGTERRERPARDPREGKRRDAQPGGGVAEDTPSASRASSPKKRPPKIECDSCGADLNEGPCGCPGGEART